MSLTALLVPNATIVKEIPSIDDSRYLAWCDGVVQSITSQKTRMVEIKWNPKKVDKGDLLITKHKLSIRSWNPKKPSQGAWRKLLGNPNA